MPVLRRVVMALRQEILHERDENACLGARASAGREDSLNSGWVRFLLVEGRAILINVAR